MKLRDEWVQINYQSNFRADTFLLSFLLMLIIVKRKKKTTKQPKNSYWFKAGSGQLYLFSSTHSAAKGKGFIG